MEHVSRSMFRLNTQTETKVIRYAIVVFWTFYWLLNVVDKVITKSIFLWAGKDRFTQFVNYFSSIGIQSPGIALFFLVLVTLLEVLAFVFVAYALIQLFKRNENLAHVYFFWGTVAGLAIFTFFSLGDQVFGDRVELWEHTSYWVALIVSWAAYKYSSKTKN
jgi:hypothetical protein